MHRSDERACELIFINGFSYIYESNNSTKSRIELNSSDFEPQRSCDFYVKNIN